MRFRIPRFSFKLYLHNVKTPPADSPPMSITALGTDMPHTAQSFLLTAGDGFYLLSCPEGTQRYCAERGHHFARPGRLRAVVLPAVSPAAVMGLPSVYMAIADNTPEGEAARLTVLARTREDAAFLEAWWRHCTVAFRNQRVAIDWLHGAWADDAVSFRFGASARLTITFPERAGTFLPDEAARLGVHKCDFAALKHGEAVRSAATPALTVLPGQVLAPPQPARTVVYCGAHGEVAPDLLAAPLDLLIVLSGNDREISAANAHIRETLKERGSARPFDVWHCAPDSAHSAFLNAACLHRALNALDAQAFPMRGNGASIAESLAARTLAPNAFRVSPELSFAVYSTKKSPMGTSARVSFREIHAEVDSERAAVRLGAPRETPQPPANGPQLYILGSGCATPSIFRNVSCALVDDGSAAGRTLSVIDCGEGSLGQLARIEDPAAFLARFGAVRIAITHGHADHHFGVWGLLRYILERSPSLLGRVRLFIPALLLPYARFMLAFALNTTERDAGGMLETLPPDGGRVAADLACARVIHSADPYGYVLTAGGADIVFSGDTRPAPALIAAGANAALLVHEATFLEGEAADAEAKQHSTVAEALAVQRAMNAKSCVLTHFSTKYIKRTGELVGAAMPVETAACAMDFARVDVRSGVPAILRSEAVAAAIECVRRVLKRRGDAAE